MKALLKKTAIYPLYKQLKINQAKKNPKRYIEKQYLKFYRESLNWNNLQKLSEKIQFLKLYVYPNDERVIEATDKYTLHNYLSINDLEYLSVPYVNIYEKDEMIDVDQLPKQFVLKKTNASGMNLIVKDKKSITSSKIKKIIGKWMAEDFGETHAEPHYSKCTSRIICENYFDIGNEYRLFMVNGEIGFVQMIIWDWETGSNKKTDIIEGHGKRYRVHLNKDWKVIWEDENTPEYLIEKPVFWDEIQKVGTIIGSQFPIVRVDFNIINDELKITELTFTPAAGYLEILRKVPELDLELGQKLNLERVATI